jgi:hypothetical protein
MLARTTPTISYQEVVDVAMTLPEDRHLYPSLCVDFYHPGVKASWMTNQMSALSSEAQCYRSLKILNHKKHSVTLIGR